MVLVTRLRHEGEYLERVVRKAVVLNFKRDQLDRDLLSVLHDYLAWLALDAVEDEELAARLVPTLDTVRRAIEEVREKWETIPKWRRVRAFYAGYLSALGTLLDAAHGRDFIAGEPLPREEFEECWELTRRALDL